MDGSIMLQQQGRLPWPALCRPFVLRKVLRPNDFADLEKLRLRLAWYDLSNRNPQPFAWKCDRAKLVALLAKIEAHEKLLAQAHANEPQKGSR